MNSRNPVLAREFGPNGEAYAGFHERPAAAGAGAAATVGADTLREMYDRPSTLGRSMTIDDVVMKTGMLFALLVGGAVIGWYVVADRPAVMLGALFAGLALGLFISFKRTTNPALIMTYAVVEGVFLGAISRYYNAAFDGVVQQAVLGTLVAFGVMLLAYRSGRLRATPAFVKFMSIAMISYLVIALASLVSSFMGVGAGWGFYGVGGLGILLCLAGVGLATFSLILDFDSIERGVAAGLPERESWRGAFGLVVSLVWLYLELLRLLAILQGRD